MHCLLTNQFNQVGPDCHQCCRVEDMYSPKTAAAYFIHELGKSRAKGHLPMLMELVQKAFQDYLVSRPPRSQPKDGLHTMC